MTRALESDPPTSKERTVIESVLPHVLVIGPQAAFRRLFLRLERTGRYRLDYVESPRAVPIFVRGRSQAVLLSLPHTPEAATGALDCLRILRGQVPVVLLAGNDPVSIRTARTHGAAACFTPATPFAEITGILDRLVQDSERKAA